MHELAAKVDEYTRGMIGPLGATLFEELGLYYIGPVDGHNIDDLICVLNEVASLDSTGPVLVHVITEDEDLESIQKGKIVGSLAIMGCCKAQFHVLLYVDLLHLSIFCKMYISVLITCSHIGC